MPERVANPVSNSTKVNKRSEGVAKALILGSALITIATLFFIVSFIVVRGFYSSTTKEYDVVSITEQCFDDWALIVNKQIRQKDLPFEQVAGIFSGEYIDWAKLSEQEYELITFLPAGANAETALNALDLTQNDISPLTKTYSDPVEAIDAVAADPGTAALVSKRDSEKLPKGVKVIPVRRVAVSANRSVVKLIGNNVLRSLDEAQRERLFSGEVRNWMELGGIDLPVVLIMPPADSPVFDLLQNEKIIPDEVLSGNAGAGPSGAPILRAPDYESYQKMLVETDGAVGYDFWSDAKRSGLAIVRSQRVEKGPNLTLPFLYEKPRMSGRVGGISTIIINTVFMILLTVFIATPIGVFAAVYLVEYAKQGKLVYFLRLGTETLAGIPSIIFGLFGMLFFVQILGWGIGLFSGTLTITLMILPTIVRTSEEALKTVPMSLREGSLALGATKLQTVLRVAIPAASPGILTGVILAIGRAVGETAALIFTMGSSYETASSLFSSARVLAVHIYLIIAEGISLDRAFATATILVFIILIVNITTTYVIGRYNRMSGK